MGVDPESSRSKPFQAAEKAGASEPRRIQAMFILMMDMGTDEGCWVAFLLGTPVQNWSNISPESGGLKHS